MFFTENRPRNEKINQESISFHPHYIHSFCMLIHYLSKSPVLYLTCLYEYSLFRLPSLSVFLLYLHRMSHLNLRPAAISPIVDCLHRGNNTYTCYFLYASPIAVLPAAICISP